MAIYVIWLLTFAGFGWALTLGNRPVGGNVHRAGFLRAGQEYPYGVSYRKGNELNSVGGGGGGGGKGGGGTGSNLLHLGRTHPYGGSHRDELSDWMVYNNDGPSVSSSRSPTSVLIDEIIGEPRELENLFFALSPAVLNVLYPEYLTSPGHQPFVYDDASLIGEHHNRARKQQLELASLGHLVRPAKRILDLPAVLMYGPEARSSNLDDLFGHSPAVSFSTRKSAISSGTSDGSNGDGIGIGGSSSSSGRSSASGSGATNSGTRGISSNVNMGSATTSSTTARSIKTDLSLERAADSYGHDVLGQSGRFFHRPLLYEPIQIPSVAASSSSSSASSSSSSSSLLSSSDSSKISPNKRNQMVLGRRNGLEYEDASAPVAAHNQPGSSSSSSATSSGSLEGASIASQFMLRSARGNRQYDVPQIECPASDDGMERFACPTADRMGRYRCIDDHVLCDGFIDCPTGEDEDRQACMFYKTTKAHLDVLADALLRWARGR